MPVSFPLPGLVHSCCRPVASIHRQPAPDSYPTRFDRTFVGKPVLITKSGSIFPSLDDVYGPLGYLELGINTFRFAYLTKLGMSKFIPSLQKLKLHIGVVIEGRDNNELPEQTLVACRIHGLDLREMASELPG
mgnify:CR=1 FL=1